ncbi:MAG: beta-galactosidase GalA [Marinilabilia sp.]
MRITKIKMSLLFLFLGVVLAGSASPRERLLMDFNWKFAFGHPNDVEQDFGTGTNYFTYLAKAGYGDGATSADFDDRTWRQLDLPHDWAAEAGFSPDASHSHGYKKIGPGFPDKSVGWYRKTFDIPEEDLGKRIFLEFDGAFRDAKVWVNGFYCGNEPSGYSSFTHDISEYLNYGGENVVAVRLDASMEEGWFYEGAGIYRHVWLTKTEPLHVPRYGTHVTSEVGNEEAVVNASVKVSNKNTEDAGFAVKNRIMNAKGEEVAAGSKEGFELDAMTGDEYSFAYKVENPRLWDIDDPHLYELQTTIERDGKIVDEYTTTFGIRTIRWDPDEGFFLNGRHVKLKGTNNHQNHAGVGTAIPDALHEWRLRQLKEMGNNTYRMAHYPPSPALLEACDRMGMLVINENRLMGTTDDIREHLKRLMIRDRNHPSVILWSIGNEEWAIEGNEKGIRIAENMQAYAKTFDATRPINVAVSGNWTRGISTVVEVMGYNYLRHGDTDKHHENYPWQPSLGTEQGSTNTTRGIYEDDRDKQYLAAYDRPTNGFMSIQQGWKHYAERDYLAGMCIWTGFDYRGEPTPFQYPSVLSYFGMMDLCGFPKDNVWYLKSWWTDEPVLHILPHWNWEGSEGEPIDVWVYSNYDEVELVVNGESYERKTMEKNGHLEWQVPYEPGTVEALAYEDGKKVATETVETTNDAASLDLSADRPTIQGDHEDVSVVTVSVTDEEGRMVPDANRQVCFDIEGPGRIIGVGNGDPTSHDPDRYFDTYRTVVFSDVRTKPVEDTDTEEAIRPSFNVSEWEKLQQTDGLEPGSESLPIIFRGQFELDNKELNGQVTWMFRDIGKEQTLYINGEKISGDLEPGEDRAFELDKKYLKEGKNTVVVVTRPFVKENEWDEVNTDFGALRVIMPAQQWQRKTFNGLAQVLVQSEGGSGTIKLKATSPDLEEAELEIEAEEAVRRPFVE